MMMNEYIEKLEKEFSKIANGYKDIEKRAVDDYKLESKEFISSLSKLAYKSDIHQVRMYAVFLLGYLSEDKEILNFMKENVSKDDNWKVQEILAKSFDQFCKTKRYGESLTTIDEWLNDENLNTRRAVTEGLRIWTTRPFFKDNPEEAIRRLSKLKRDSSEYVRKSVGNALRDISKKFPELIKQELESWELDTKEIKQVYRLASKFIEKTGE